MIRTNAADVVMFNTVPQQSDHHDEPGAFFRWACILLT
jgi:hypothetical protein